MFAEMVSVMTQTDLEVVALQRLLALLQQLLPLLLAQVLLLHDFVVVEVFLFGVFSVVLHQQRHLRLRTQTHAEHEAAL